MKAVLSAASVLAITAGASAAPFQFLSYEAGGPVKGIMGAGFTASSGSFFKDGFNAGSLLFTSAGFYGFGNLEQDSAFTIDPFGPAVASGSNQATRDFYGDYPAGDYQANNASTAFGLIVGPGSGFDGSGGAFLGLGISPQPFFSGFAPNPGGGRSDLDGVFIARLTVEDGATISGDGLFAIQGIDAQTVVLDGDAVDFGGQPLALRSYLVIDNGPNGDTYDIWFQLIPSPGSLALVGLGGIAALRRRRA